MVIHGDNSFLEQVFYANLFLGSEGVLESFSGPEPGGMESMIRKWKRERGWYPLVYAEDQ